MEALDSYLHKQAGQDARERAAVPFVATPDGQTIAGYYTLSQYAIALDAIPEQKGCPGIRWFLQHFSAVLQ